MYRELPKELPKELPRDKPKGNLKVLRRRRAKFTDLPSNKTRSYLRNFSSKIISDSIIIASRAHFVNTFLTFCPPEGTDFPSLSKSSGGGYSSRSFPKGPRLPNLILLFFKDLQQGSGLHGTYKLDKPLKNKKIFRGANHGSGLQKPYKITKL